MSDNYVQSQSATGAAAPTVTLTSVVAGNTLVAILADGQAGHTLSGVSDGQGSYTSQGSQISDNVNNVFLQVYVLQNANSGSHVVTGSIPSSGLSHLTVIEVGTTGGTSAFSGTNGLFQNTPGTSTDAVTSNSVTVTGAATLVALGADTASLSSSNEPATGTGFTSRVNTTDSAIGAWRIESAAVSANTAATFTAISGVDTYLTVAVAILNSAGTGDTFTNQICM